MSEDPPTTAAELMRSAWATRREYLEASAADRPPMMDAARVQLVEAVELCRGGDDPVELAQALHLLAHVELDRKRADAALELWEEAVAILRETGDALQLAHKLRHLGDLHAHGRRLPEAEGCYEEALRLYRAHSGPGSLDFANAVRPAAMLKQRLGKHDEALVLWREARELYAAVSVQAGVDEAARRIARLET